MKGRNPRGVDEATGGIGGAALLGCVLGALLASSVAVVTEVRTIDIGPKVGDILVFRPGAQVAADWEFPATAAGQTAQTCTLKPNVMLASGGSLVVEERLPGLREFHVHWAGARTNDGASNCGNSADLVVTEPDLQLLTNAVGGAGVQRKGFPGF
jgi:hypothetical protein